MNYSLLDSDHSSQSEKKGSLIPEWIDKINKEAWFQLFVPKSLGGLGLDLPEALRIEQKLANLDGSLGWTVTLCSGALWFVGFLDESLREGIFPNPGLCFAGSGFVGGKAEIVENGYMISGSWTYASGALHASHFTANCEIWKDGNLLNDEQGNPVIKAFILNKEEVEILGGWNYMGMIATGSHAFKTESLHVPFNRSFEIIPERATLTDPIFQFPFQQFAEATLVANILGISQHLQTLIQVAFWKRNSIRKYSDAEVEYAEKQFAISSKSLETAANDFYSSVETAWATLIESGAIRETELKDVSKRSRELVQVCRETNMSIYPFSGLEAAKMETELNRVWRDFATVSQHALITFPYFD